MTTPESELRATSDELLAALDQLAELEREKRTLPPEDPRLLEIASGVQRLASSVFEAARLETDLAETAHVMALTDAVDAPSRPIDAIPRALPDILDDWRAAERDVAGAEPGSLEAAEAQSRARMLRDEYQRAYAEHARSRHPERS